MIAFAILLVISAVLILTVGRWFFGCLSDIGEIQKDRGQ